MAHSDCTLREPVCVCVFTILSSKSTSNGFWSKQKTIILKESTIVFSLFLEHVHVFSVFLSLKFLVIGEGVSLQMETKV